VLTEGDDPQDPIADAARAILDGHIVLSRTLGEAGHYPAIDVEASISRAMHNIVSEDQFHRAKQLKAAFSKYQRNRDLISVGAYVHGSDPMLDRAILQYPQIEAFLQQDMNQSASMAASLSHLEQLFPHGKNTA
jgi:flagellum-specific ATP synthase